MLELSMAVNWEFIQEVGAFRWLRRTFSRQFSKRILHRDSAIVLPTGLRMALPRTSKFASEVFITHANVDWGSEALFASHLDPAGVVLDIGANIGYYSLYLLPRVAAVHSFEPDPRVLAALRSNLAENSNAYVHTLAVGNHIGKARFALAPDSEVSHVVSSSMKTGENSHEVDLTTIDRFVSDNRLSVTGIKIDVEGADIDVIEGGLETLASQTPLVLTETEPGERLFGLIRPLGYSVFAFVKNSALPRFVLREIHSGDRWQTKMLFLVPNRLQSTFESLVGKHAENISR